MRRLQGQREHARAVRREGVPLTGGPRHVRHLRLVAVREREQQVGPGVVVGPRVGEELLRGEHGLFTDRAVERVPRLPRLLQANERVCRGIRVRGVSRPPSPPAVGVLELVAAEEPRLHDPVQRLREGLVRPPELPQGPQRLDPRREAVERLLDAAVRVLLEVDERVEHATVDARGEAQLGADAPVDDVLGHHEVGHRPVLDGAARTLDLAHAVRQRLDADLHRVGGDRRHPLDVEEDRADGRRADLVVEREGLAGRHPPLDGGEALGLHPLDAEHVLHLLVALEGVVHGADDRGLVVLRQEPGGRNAGHDVQVALDARRRGADERVARHSADGRLPRRQVVRQLHADRRLAVLVRHERGGPERRVGELLPELGLHPVDVAALREVPPCARGLVGLAAEGEEDRLLVVLALRQVSVLAGPPPALAVTELPAGPASPADPALVAAGLRPTLRVLGRGRLGRRRRRSHVLVDPVLERVGLRLLRVLGQLPQRVDRPSAIDLRQLRAEGLGDVLLPLLQLATSGLVEEVDLARDRDPVVAELVRAVRRDRPRAALVVEVRQHVRGVLPLDRVDRVVHEREAELAAHGLTVLVGRLHAEDRVLARLQVSLLGEHGHVQVLEDKDLLRVLVQAVVRGHRDRDVDIRRVEVLHGNLERVRTVRQLHHAVLEDLLRLERQKRRHARHGAVDHHLRGLVSQVGAAVRDDLRLIREVLGVAGNLDRRAALDDPGPAARGELHDVRPGDLDRELDFCLA